MASATILETAEASVKIGVVVWNSESGKFSFDKPTAVRWHLQQGQALALTVGATRGFGKYTSGNELHVFRDSALLQLFPKGTYVELTVERPPIASPSPDIVDLPSVEESFNPESLEDGRQKIVKSLIARQGASSFRSALLKAYDGRCAATECDFLPALEAAHIYPYRGPATNLVQNGLLLRSDVHTLFDLGWLAIDNARWVIHSDLKRTQYGDLSGRAVIMPRDPAHRPSNDYLRRHRTETARF